MAIEWAFILPNKVSFETIDEKLAVQHMGEILTEMDLDMIRTLSEFLEHAESKLMERIDEKEVDDKNK